MLQGTARTAPGAERKSHRRDRDLEHSTAMPGAGDVPRGAGPCAESAGRKSDRLLPGSHGMSQHMARLNSLAWTEPTEHPSKPGRKLSCPTGNLFGKLANWSFSGPFQSQSHMLPTPEMAILFCQATEPSGSVLPVRPENSDLARSQTLKCHGCHGCHVHGLHMSAYMSTWSTSREKRVFAFCRFCEFWLCLSPVFRTGSGCKIQHHHMFWIWGVTPLCF